MLDEAALIDGARLRPRLFPQPHLQRGERADDPQPRLRHHHGYPRQVRRAEPGIPHPPPPPPSTRQDQQLPDHHEGDKGDVRQQHGIRQHAVQGGGLHGPSLQHIRRRRAMPVRGRGETQGPSPHSGGFRRPGKIHPCQAPPARPTLPPPRNGCPTGRLSSVGRATDL